MQIPSANSSNNDKNVRNKNSIVNQVSIIVESIALNITLTVNTPENLRLHLILNQTYARD